MLKRGKCLIKFYKVVNLCWKHGMYDALFYIYNCGLRDYTTPLVELLTVLSTAVSSGKQLSEQHITLGNKLLVYISCCLAGRAYPLGDIPDDLVLQVKEQVFATITQLHSKKPPADEPVYPHLKTLLRYDTREFLNVLALGFEDPEFQTEEGLAKRQRVVDILLQIMVESVGFTTGVLFQPTQNGCLFTFLARQMGKPAPTIMVNRVLFEQVLESLCRSGEDTRHEERQQALLELLQAGGLQHFDEERLITMATEAQFFRVCELMYEKRRQFQKILACYWNDTARQLKSFRYIQDVMNDSSYMYTITEKTAVRREAIANIQVLVGLDSQQAAALVLGCLACNITEVVNLLRNDEKTLFVFMQGLFEQREFLSGGGDRVLDAEIHELYVELMCEQKPENVLSYLKSADGYRLEETLQVTVCEEQYTAVVKERVKKILKIVREHEIMDATAYMLEKAGDSQGAFDILHSSLLDNIQRWMEVAVKQPDEEGLAPQWTDIEQQLAMVVQLCQRSSGKLKDTEREALWFPLLDSVLVPQRRWKEQLTDKHIQAFKDLTREVLNGMMGYVGLPSVLQKIMQDSSYSGIFGELRELILSMLDTYNYEKTLLHCCTRLVNHDLHQQLAALTAVASRGTVPKTTKCSLCTKSLLTPSEQDLVIAFRCGHGYHVPCLRSTGSKVTVDGEESWICYLCNSSKRSRLPSSSPAGRFQRQTSASSHSPLIKSGHITAASSEKQAGVLEPEQILAIDALRRAQRTSFRLASLSDHEHGSSPHHHNRHAAARNSNSILHNEHFQLRVAHPPPDFVS